MIIKSELIDMTYRELNGTIEKYKIEKIINTFVNILSDKLRLGTDIKISNIGTFTHTYRKTYLGKNVNTGQTEVIPATRYIRFKPSKNLK